MRHLLILHLTTLLIACYSRIDAQEQQAEFTHCGADEGLEQMLLQHPSLKQYRKELEVKTLEFIANSGSYKTEAGCIIYIIPVVVHRENTTNEIDAGIAQALVDELTLYFRRRNPYTADLESSIQPAFRNILADVQIEFKLAKKDNNGLPTPGFVNEPAFTSWNVNNFTLPQYFEIYITDVSPLPGSGATATYPGGAITAPGVSGLVGNGVTLAHETGHWLNLYHTFGNTNGYNNPTNCFLSDGVDDTPPCKGGTSCYSPETNPVNTCHEDVPDLPDNYQNFMDYRTGCRLMFTEGQKARMLAALTIDPTRKKLWTTENLNLTGLSTAMPKFPCLKTAINSLEALNSKLSIYPNPVAEDTKINFQTDKKEAVYFSIYTVTGQTILNTERIVGAGMHTYNFAEIMGDVHLLPGIYFFQVDSSNDRYIQKFIQL